MTMKFYRHYLLYKYHFTWSNFWTVHKLRNDKKHLNFKVNLSKVHFIWPILFNFANTRYLFLLVRIICARSNEGVANAGCTNVCFMINGWLRTLPRHFRYFHCSNCKMTFDKILMKKLPFLTSSKFEQLEQWKHQKWQGSIFSGSLIITQTSRNLSLQLLSYRLYYAH